MAGKRTRAMSAAAWARARAPAMTRAREERTNANSTLAATAARLPDRRRADLDRHVFARLPADRGGIGRRAGHRAVHTRGVLRRPCGRAADAGQPVGPARPARA